VRGKEREERKPIRERRGKRPRRGERGESGEKTKGERQGKRRSRVEEKWREKKEKGLIGEGCMRDRVRQHWALVCVYICIDRHV
jgi:hypothetical protein